MDIATVLTIRQAHKTFYLCRDRQEGIHRPTVGLAAQLQREGEPKIRNEGERVRGVNSKRSQDRKDLL